MPKGYWIANVNVHNLEGYKKYVEANGAVFRDYGAKFLVRGGSYDTVEGDDLGSRHVVIEFRDVETARACYFSEAYQEVAKIRLANSTGRITIAEGAR